ncbi:MAG: thioredoxin [Gammaproteobacteria bacterium]|nr:MAG: thioredoxin [Gammaproteobacteria bacterium]
MNKLQNIYDVSDETFHAAVVKRSHQVPVLVDYWAEWCGPCQMQMPVLKKLIAEHDGQVLLAKVNTDEQRALAREHGIRSLPTMRLYKDGVVVEEILGAQTEATLRVLLDRHMARASDQLRAAALETRRQGNATEALQLLREARDSDPDNYRILLDCAEIELELGDINAAAATLEALPRDIREEAEAIRLHALLGFARIVENAPATEDLEDRIGRQPDDLQARHQLASRYVLADRPEPALRELLYILQHDRNYGQDAGRKGLLAVFDMLGNEGDLVSEYRRKLVNSIY